MQVSRGEIEDENTPLSGLPRSVSVRSATHWRRWPRPVLSSTAMIGHTFDAYSNCPLDTVMIWGTRASGSVTGCR